MDNQDDQLVNVTPDTPVKTTPTEPDADTTSAPTETPISSASHERPSSNFDVFHWANEIDEVKNNVSVELFLFN